MDLAPVVDVVPPGHRFHHENPGVSGDADAHTVADLGTTVIQTLQSSGIMAVAKHFSGIGRTVLDSHHQLPELDVDMADLQAVDLIPL